MAQYLFRCDQKINCKRIKRIMMPVCSLKMANDLPPELSCQTLVLTCSWLLRSFDPPLFSFYDATCPPYSPMVRLGQNVAKKGNHEETLRSGAGPMDPVQQLRRNQRRSVHRDQSTWGVWTNQHRQLSAAQSNQPATHRDHAITCPRAALSLRAARPPEALGKALPRIRCLWAACVFRPRGLGTRAI